MLIRNVSTDVMNRGFPRVDRNSFFIFEVTGRCIGHLGQLRHIPDAAQFAAVWWLDVLLMHWFSGALLEVFLAEIADQFDLVRPETSQIDLSLARLPGKPTIIVLELEFLP